MAGQNFKFWQYIFSHFLTNYCVFHAGYGEKDKPNTQTEDLLNDTRRADYMSSYLGALETSMRYKQCYNTVNILHVLL